MEGKECNGYREEGKERVRYKRNERGRGKERKMKETREIGTKERGSEGIFRVRKNWCEV